MRARTRLSLVQDLNGKPLYVVGHTEDIQERERSEVALRESEERFRIMAHGCPAMMWVTDADGRNRFINRAYRDFCGIASDGAEAERWGTTASPGRRGGLYRKLLPGES